jgi:hypothetical protein
MIKRAPPRSKSSPTRRASHIARSKSLAQNPNRVAGDHKTSSGSPRTRFCLTEIGHWALV